MKTILIGFMGSGKSAVARALAAQTGDSVLETDRMVLDQLECVDMAAVFKRGGELLLRETEIAVARSLKNTDSGIISTGGGMVLNKICIDYLRERNGMVVFLDAPFDILYHRVQADSTPRPLFSDLESARKLHAFRHPLYTAYADTILRVSRETPDELAAQITRLPSRS